MNQSISSGKRFSVLGPKDSLQRLLAYFLLFLVIGFILLMIVRKLAYIGFDTMDDIQIQNLLNGSKGPSYGFCIYLNVILGSFLANLYTVFPAYNWYAIFLLGMLLISCALIAAVLAQRLGGKAGFAVGFTVFPLVFLVVLLNFTFTMIAYIVLAGAFLNIAYAFYLKDKKRKLFLWISAAVLCALAVMIREETFFSAVALGALYALFLLIRYKKTAFASAAMIAGILMISFALIAFNASQYESDPAWSGYNRFNKAITDTLDRSHPTYRQNQENFQKHGWSENDYQLFYTYNIPDDDKFSTENLEKVGATYNTFARYDLNIQNVFSSIFDFIKNSIPLILMLAAAFYLALITSKARLLTIALLLFPFFIQAVLVAMQRPLERVIVPHYFISLILMFCLIDTQALKDRFLKNAGTRGKRALPLLALILTLCITVYPFYDTFSYCRALAEHRKDPVVAANYNQQMLIYDYYNMHPDNFYVYTMDDTFFNYNTNYSIFDTKPQNYYLNSFGLGGWTTRSKFYDDFKRNAGLQSLPRDLIDNDHVYFLTMNGLDMYTKYFWETYGIPVKYVVADNYAGFNIMRIRTAASMAEMGTTSAAR